MGSIDPLRGEANALSIPPGQYGRKAKTQRNRRGLAQAVEHVVQFDDKRRTLPGLDIPPSYLLETGEIRKKGGTGAAWLSSARAVRGSVQSGNERNPCRVLYVSRETARDNREEGGDDVKSAWPLCPGRHTCYSGRYNGLPSGNAELIPKTGLGSDCGLPLARMKKESLVIAHQPWRGEYVLKSCTHRPSGQ